MIEMLIVRYIDVHCFKRDWHNTQRGKVRLLVGKRRVKNDENWMEGRGLLVTLIAAQYIFLCRVCSLLCGVDGV